MVYLVRGYVRPYGLHTPCLRGYVALLHTPRKLFSVGDEIRIKSLLFRDFGVEVGMVWGILKQRDEFKLLFEICWEYDLNSMVANCHG